MKKVVLVLFVVMLVLCLLCVICTSIIGLIMQSSLGPNAKSLKDDVVLELCNTHGKLDGDSAELFTEKYTSSHNIDEAQEIVEKAFPETLVCERLLPESVLDMIATGQSLNVRNINGIQSAEYSFGSEKGRTTISFVKSDANKWIVSDIVTE